MQPDHKFLGIEIGGTKLQLVKADAAGRIEKTLRYAIDPLGGAQPIQMQIQEGLTELNVSNDISAIGVGFGGPVDWKTGTIRVSHQVAGWGQFNFVQWLQQLTGLPVAIENDANTAALAEAIHGSGKGYERVFYMTIGSGIGGGMIINGDVYHGKAPGEVEVGHLRLNKEGDTVEQRCSGWAVNKKVKEVIAQQPESLLAKLSFQYEGAEATLLKPALESGDAAAKKIIEEVADDLAFALSHVVHLFHPDVLAIGGGLSLLKEHLLHPIHQKLPQYIMQAFLPPPEVTFALLEEDVVQIGALELEKRIVFKEAFYQNI